MFRAEMLKRVLQHNRPLADMRGSERIAGSLRLDAGRFNYFGPLLGFIDDELPEVGR